MEQYISGVKPKDKVQIEATVKACSSIEEAQMGLLNILSQFSRILANAETYGLKVGDVGFAINENDTVIFVTFVKNNITVVVKNVDVENSVSVKEVTAKIDSLI